MFLVDETNSFFIEFVHSCYTNEIVPSSHLDKNISLELSQGGWVLHLLSFLYVISFVLAMVMDYIPKAGFIGRWFNTHPFNHKEHAAVLIV
jgi:hypothetical protein